ncbi:MAG: dithiol-disulfide isomerase [Actinobacteria bacterium]|nr:dithiol-disulfide isomerase [Actinomycetota bacterium]
MTVWSDIGCPWASLALHVLRDAATQRGYTLLVDHRAFPLELFNERPTPRPIIDAEVIAIVGLVPDTGWRAWGSPSWHYPSSTLLAMEAVQAAKSPEVGGLTGSDALDAALRHAFYAEGRCIGIPSVITEVAKSIDVLDAELLSRRLEEGTSRASIYRDWRVAAAPEVRGSPQFFDAAGRTLHNPGVDYRWTSSPDTGGVPRFESYDDTWVEVVLGWTQPG